MSTNNKKKVILGAGLAGLSCAYHLKNGYELYEKEFQVGGLCRSRQIDGFTFDYDGHLLHFKDGYTLKLLRNLLDGNLTVHLRNSWIKSHGTYSRYPFQANTYGLPPGVAKECLLGFLQARARYSNQPTNDGLSFEEWIFRTFGEGIATHFMIPYNKKFWTVHPRNLTCEWIDGYIPVPSLEEVLSGALSESVQPLGYNVRFWYPVKGGIAEVPLVFQRHIHSVNLSCEVIRIDSARKTIEFKNGWVISYDTLISTLPLPELAKLIKEIPPEVAAAFKKLCYSSIFTLNLGISRETISDKHWIYFPEEEFVFFRVGFPMNFSASLSPDGTSSLYAEVSYLPGQPVDKEKLPSRIIEDLIKAQIISGKDEIIIQDAVDITYGYIIYDKYRQESLKKIFEFLNEHHIHSIGRYGRWRYMSMEDVILDGKKMANSLNGRSLERPSVTPSKKPLLKYA